jgi:hypothetical protein
MSDESTTEAAVTLLAERVKLTARGFDSPECCAPMVAPLGDPESDIEAWRLLASATSLLSWLTEGAPGKDASWDEPRSLAMVLVGLGEVEVLLLRFRVALVERLRELASESESE